MANRCKREFLLPPGEGHDCRDAGGRAMHGAIAEDEGIYNQVVILLYPLTPTLSRWERELTGQE
jgi:hypothetical protein